MRKSHCLPNQKKFVCSFRNCQKSYALKNILLAHLRTHYKIKPFICSYCSKSFNEKGNLKTHIRIHTGERPFTCKKCHKSFKALGQLKDHFISHTGLKPFQCPHCKKYYRRKEILKNHFEIHKKELFFTKNEEKYKEMLDNINKIKNMVLDFDNSNFIYKDSKEIIANVNNINSTTSGAVTNLSCSMSSNEEPKECFYNIDKQDKISINKNKKLNIKVEGNEKEKSLENANTNEKKNISNKEEINLNEFLDQNINQILSDPDSQTDIKLQIYPDINIQHESNLDINIKDSNNNFFCDDISIESKDFSFQNLSHRSEKENSVRFYLTNFNCEEKTDKEIENYDCYSKITNLYFQPYQNMMKYNK